MAGSLNGGRIKDFPEICRSAAIAYENGATTREVAIAIGLSISTARTAILSAGVTLRTVSVALKRKSSDISARMRGIKRGPVSEETKQKIRESVHSRAASFSGVSLKPNGYMEITRGRDKFKSVHRRVMEDYLGRKLSRNECVHHVDGNKLNNNIENLELMSRAEHASIHAKENANKRKRSANGKFA